MGLGNDKVLQNVLGVTGALSGLGQVIQSGVKTAEDAKIKEEQSRLRAIQLDAAENAADLSQSTTDWDNAFQGLIDSGQISYDDEDWITKGRDIIKQDASDLDPDNKSYDNLVGYRNAVLRRLDFGSKKDKAVLDRMVKDTKAQNDLISAQMQKVFLGNPEDGNEGLVDLWNSHKLNIGNEVSSEVVDGKRNAKGEQLYNYTFTDMNDGTQESKEMSIQEFAARGIQLNNPENYTARAKQYITRVEANNKKAMNPSIFYDGNGNSVQGGTFVDPYTNEPKFVVTGENGTVEYASQAEFLATDTWQKIDQKEKVSKGKYSAHIQKVANNVFPDNPDAKGNYLKMATYLNDYDKSFALAQDMAVVDRQSFEIEDEGKRQKFIDDQMYNLTYKYASQKQKKSMDAFNSQQEAERKQVIKSAADRALREKRKEVSDKPTRKPIRDVDVQLGIGGTIFESGRTIGKFLKSQFGPGKKVFK